MAAVEININGIQGLLFPVGVDSASMASPGVVQLNLTQIDFETNGTNNLSQTVLNLQSGPNILVSNPSGGNVAFALGGPAGGDLGGTYPNPSVARVNGAPVPVSAQVLASNSSGQLVSQTGTIANNTSGSAAKVNGGAIPVNANVLGSNGTGQLIAQTGLVLSIVTKTANYTATPSDYTVLADATAGPLTVTLPSPSNGFLLNIKKIDASVHAVTVTGGTIDGAASQTLSTQYQFLQLQFDPASSAWWII